jgi:hypothetical protein
MRQPASDLKYMQSENNLCDQPSCWSLGHTWKIQGRMRVRTRTGSVNFRLFSIAFYRPFLDLCKRTVPRVTRYFTEPDEDRTQVSLFLSTACVVCYGGPMGRGKGAKTPPIASWIMINTQWAAAWSAGCSYGWTREAGERRIHRAAKDRFIGPSDECPTVISFEPKISLRITAT